MSLFEILMRGGWLMVPIVLSSIVVIALGISRFLAIRAEKDKYTRFLFEWKTASPATDFNLFNASCREGPTAMGEIAAMLVRERYSERGASEKIESMSRAELSRLETGLGTIATLAAATPLLGFLGTVTGMIRAFMQIQNLGGNVNANVLAGGIWEALVTTAAGLAVGIIALIIHNYLAALTGQIARQIEEAGDITLLMLGRRHEA